MNCLLFVAVVVARWLCRRNGEQLLNGEGGGSFSLFLFTCSVNSYSPVFSSTHSPLQCDRLFLSHSPRVCFAFSRLKFSFDVLSHNNFQYLSPIYLFFFLLSLSLCYRQSNLFTHLRMNWSRVHCWRCMQHSPGTFPRTRSQPQRRPASIKVTSTSAASRTPARCRDSRDTVRPRPSPRARRCVITWTDHKPRQKAKVELCLCTRTPSRTTRSTTRRNG